MSRIVKTKEHSNMVHSLRYVGNIVKKGVKYGLIEINGSLYPMKEGDTAEEYTLKMLGKESASLIWKDETCDVPLSI